MAFKKTVVKVCNEAAKYVVKRSPEILTVLGVTGFLSTTILAVKSTPEALRRIGKRKRELCVTQLSKKETVKAAWKCYIPATVTAVISTGCIIGGSTINYKRNMALTAAYAISETAFKDYKEKVEETLTKKDVERVKDAVAKTNLEKNPINDDEVIITKQGNNLCYDITSGRYFRSDINKIKQTINELNERLLNEQFISQNDLFYELGLDLVGGGYELGWDATDGLIRVEYSSQIASNGEPCLTINYMVSPLRKYRH